MHKETHNVKKLYIWGAGEIGRRVFQHLDDDWEVTFVDANEELAGSCFYGKKIITVKDYFEYCSDEFILIAHLSENESLKILQDNQVSNYFLHCNCPGEFREPYARDFLKKYVSNYLAEREDFVLYGLDLYSIIIDGWLYSQYGRHPFILVQDEAAGKFVDKIQQKYPGLKLLNSVGQLKGIQEICVCSDNYRQLKHRDIFNGYQVTDLFDCTDRISDYYNSAIKKFHHIHKGQRCFIVATGPSLKVEDLDLLMQRNELCISMNSIFHIFGDTKWKPDYYVAHDYRVLDICKESIDSWSVKSSFIGDTSKDFWKMPHGDNIYRYHEHYEYFLDRKPKFSNDFSLCGYIGATVTYTCMQLAAYMGFHEIYLLGVDFSYGGQQKNSTYVHFYKDGTSKSVGFANQVLLAYQTAEQYAKAHGIKIYNATRGGNLEVFERVEFDSLF